LSKKNEEQQLVAKRLRTGEIAVWDGGSRSIILLAEPGREGTITARVIRGASFKALEQSLGSIVVLGA